MRGLESPMTSLVMVWLAGVAQAKEPADGVEVTVKVVDAATGAPIPTAVVRHPDEQDRHRVNSASGEWTGSVLYLPDGTELLFAKGLQLELEVSAPDYVNSRLSYKVRKRRN